MLVNMFGAPSSGKSTIAANVFARLKTDGIPAEFISERAREVIAKFKFKKIKTMSDEMQLEILEAQYHAETYFKHSTDYPVIADSSTLLTLAYGTESFFQRYGDRVQQLVSNIVSEMDVVFYLPLRDSVQDDPNRIHNYEQCLEVDSKIRNILNTYLKDQPHIKIVELTGGIQEMTDKVLSELENYNGRQVSR